VTAVCRTTREKKSMRSNAWYSRVILSQEKKLLKKASSIQKACEIPPDGSRALAPLPPAFAEQQRRNRRHRKEENQNNKTPSSPTNNTVAVAMEPHRSRTKLQLLQQPDTKVSKGCTKSKKQCWGSQRRLVREKIKSTRT